MSRLRSVRSDVLVVAAAGGSRGVAPPHEYWSEG
jgi:hypothetical protein